jgi:hypothetical protein
MTERVRAIPRRISLALPLLLAAAAAASSQQAPLDRELLTRYARAYVATSAARDEFYARIARIHDDVGLARARAEMDARIAEILRGNALTSEQYGELTLLVSQDERVRVAFEEIVRELREQGSRPR